MSKLPRSSVWIPLAVGLLFLVFGITTGNVVASLIGITILSVIITLLLRTDGILRKESIIDQWSTLVKNAQGKANGVFQTTNANIDASKAPHVYVSRQRLTSESTGELRPFLVVSNNQNINLKGFQMLLSCRDYGTNLVVDWYVTYTPSLWQAVVAMLISRSDLGTQYLRPTGPEGVYNQRSPIHAQSS